MEQYLSVFDVETFRKSSGQNDPKKFIKEAKKRRQQAKTENAKVSDVVAPSTSLEIQQVFEHGLIGKIIMQKWLDFSLRPVVLYGVVRGCWKDPTDNSFFFDVEHKKESVTVMTEIAPGWKFKDRQELSENVAWGCRQFFEERRDGIVSAITAAQPKFLWIVPDCVRDVASFPPRRRLVVKNFSIELQARQSEIPGAGFGVFMKVTSEGLRSAKRFVLECNEMIDLGVYGPTRLEDLRDHSVQLVKSFVFDGKPEEWAFDSEIGNHAHVYDITDDVTGDLHHLAKQNVLVYVNETDGKETPTIHAQRDPFSHIHYLLGSSPGRGQFSVECGKWIELKIDYGAGYEEIRIRKGYSRLPVDSEERQKKENEDHDLTTLQDIKDQWTPPEIEPSIDYLARIDVPALGIRQKAKSLVVLLCLWNRLVRTKADVDEQGLRPVPSKALDLVLKITESLTDEELYETFAAPKSFKNKSQLDRFLEVVSRDSFYDSGASIRTRIFGQVTKRKLMWK